MLSVDRAFGVSDFEYRREQEREAEAAERVPEPAPPQHAPAARLASSIGNRAFSALAREGAGIMPDGRAHPDVEATIAQTRGQGTTLDGATRERFSPGLGDSLSDVRVHTDDKADALSRSVSARAFTTGNDVYFARGEYAPATEQGNQLLAHELSHVVQQRGAPTSGPMVSQPGDALEADADAAAHELTG
jgi:hypothetical protein